MKTQSRRDFLKLSASSLALTPLASASAQTSVRTTATRRKASPKIIFLVSDGMSWGALSATNVFTQKHLGFESPWHKLMRMPDVKQSLMETASYDSYVTDSAAAGSAWGSGHKVNNGAINVGPKGEQYEPIFTAAKRKGLQTAVVSTARVTHATPASFIANIDDRNKEDDLAAQYLERGADIILGGGTRHFAAESRKDGKDLFKAFAEKGYTVYRDRKSLLAELDKPTEKPVLGTFWGSNVPYHIDWLNVPAIQETVPTLAEMTQFALNKLEAAPDGFILQVEGARIDHAAHDNCTAGLIHDQIAFEETITVALNFRARHPDTLIIVTSDHGNACPSNLGAGWGYRESTPRYDLIGKFTESYELLLPKLKEAQETAAIQKWVYQATQIELNASQLQGIYNAFRGQPESHFKDFTQPQSILSLCLANYVAFGWSGVSHTNEHCPVTAVGPNAERLPSLIDNTELYPFLIAALG